MEAVVELLWTASYGSTTSIISVKRPVSKRAVSIILRLQGQPGCGGLDEAWRHHRAELDPIFSPTVPPLERLRNTAIIITRFRRK